MHQSDDFLICKLFYIIDPLKLMIKFSQSVFQLIFENLYLDWRTCKYTLKLAGNFHYLESQL